MAAEKTYNKKLIRSGGGVFTLTLFAALLSLAAALGEVIAVALYNAFYSNPVDHIFAADAEQYLLVHQYAIVMAVFAVIMFIWAASSMKNRKLGREFGFFGIFLNCALCVMPIYKTVDQAMKRETGDAFSKGLDGDKFRMAFKLMINALPLLAGVLILLAGVSVMVKLSGVEACTVTRPARKNKPQPEDEYEGFADPHSFGTNSSSSTDSFTSAVTGSDTAVDNFMPVREASAAPAAIAATSEDPKAFGKALIFVALGEGIALYGLLISIMIFSQLGQLKV